MGEHEVHTLLSLAHPLAPRRTYSLSVFLYSFDRVGLASLLDLEASTTARVRVSARGGPRDIGVPVTRTIIQRDDASVSVSPQMAQTSTKPRY